MNRFPDNHDVQLRAITLLRSLAKNHRIHARVMGEHGAVSLLLRAMQKFPDSALLQEWACYVLDSLAELEENKQLIIYSPKKTIIMNFRHLLAFAFFLGPVYTAKTLEKNSKGKSQQR